MKSRTMKINIMLLIPAIFLAGCKLMPTAKFDPNDPNSSFVYGYIDTTQMSSQYEWVKIRGTAGKDDYVTATTTKEGAFYHIAVRPGHRYISAFGGWNSSSIHAQNAATVFRFDEKSENGPSIDIKKPGLHFIGSYKLLITGKTFDMKKTKSPSRKDVLRMILNAMKENGHNEFYPRQYKMVKDQLAS